MATPEERVQTEQVEVATEKRQVSGRQLAMVLGGLLLLLVLVWFFLLRGGDEEPTTAAPPVPPPATTPAPGDGGGGDGGGAGQPGDGPVETFEVFAPKDPFDPLLSEAGTTEEGETTDGGETTDTGDTTDTDDTTDTTDGTTDTNGDGVVDGSDTGGSGGTGPGSSDTVQGHSVELVATLEDGSVQVQVDDRVYTVDEGEQFAQNFELVSVSGDCATLLYGDDQFTLCEGEEILK